MEEPERRKVGERKKRVFGDNTHKHLEQLRKHARALTGEVNFEQEDLGLDTTRIRLAGVLKRKEQLKENLTRETGKSLEERLRREFETARISETQEISLNDDQWNGGVLARIRERVHMETELRKSNGHIDSQHEQLVREKITYKLRNKVICCLEGGRICIEYDTFFAGEQCDIYYCVLGSKSFLEKMRVVEHTIPFFLPINEAEDKFLSSDPMKFIDYVGEMLQAYVDRREQVRLLKELYGGQIRDLYNTLPFDMITFVMDAYNFKVIVELIYDDTHSELPTKSKVQAWPLSLKAMETCTGRQGSGSAVNGITSSPLPYAEDALKTISLPRAFAEIALNLQGTLRHIFPSFGTLSVHSSGAD
ncbi:hypothetical protein SUGI_0577200 [Cryptomeria japonica]|uniref:uncharacterized protein LOC131037403 isoform X2 n=1 Tax=Cryptomeria japonica TaxID=3369 RepID=UPI002408C664|nr:uncharacterized protein LOC131037403 isoform X2 [Cryptomeria japonica]GLJ29267.1 hypothetical protein SUGI_0577200 [Cryptomeria japonica]